MFSGIFSALRTHELHILHPINTSRILGSSQYRCLLVECKNINNFTPSEDDHIQDIMWKQGVGKRSIGMFKTRFSNSVSVEELVSLAKAALVLVHDNTRSHAHFSTANAGLLGWDEGVTVCWYPDSLASPSGNTGGKRTFDLLQN